VAQKIIGAQRDFSFGEVDVALKRADDHPARKAGLRQMSNLRILDAGGVQDRPGRSALFPALLSSRIEEVTMSPGNTFKIAFGASTAAGEIRVFDASGSQVAYFTTQGSGLLLPWSRANVSSIVIAQIDLSVYITFGHGMRPQVLTWDGVSVWTIADYSELLISGQKRTLFYRISPQGIRIQPSARTGSVTVTADTPVFAANWVGRRIRYVNRQLLITAYTDSTHVTATVQEVLPPSQTLQFSVDPTAYYSVGDVVLGSATGAKALVISTSSSPTQIVVQLLAVTSAASGSQVAISFANADFVVGPAGSLQSTGQPSGNPEMCAIWDDEVMNDSRGYPASVFADQFRLGFCDFPAVPNGIAWSAINFPTDLYVVGALVPNGAIFELAPDKVQVYYVVPGAESSEFVFCDRKIYYIKIDASNPLVPGSVGFQTLSSDGAGQVQPKVSQEVILYANAGRSSMMAIIASGAYYRPFNTKSLTSFHAHLFSDIVCIAVPTADGTFNERYAYVLNSNNSLVVGKYNLGDISSEVTKVGWGPWSGVGTVLWVASYAADVLFTTSYFGGTICEVLDDGQYLDGAISVNALPPPFNPPLGKGPLWWTPSQSVSLIDQGTRSMGTYSVDANGFITPQGNAGENLGAAYLIAGQPWTATMEPFAPAAPPGPDAGQRMKMRQISLFAAYIVHSTGFVLGHLFSGRVTRNSPAFGTLMNERRFPAWMQDDDPTLPPPQRETVESYPPTGSSYDPRVVLIKDTPGPLQILELSIEVSV
jgi:hypothetical protein